MLVVSIQKVKKGTGRMNETRTSVLSSIHNMNMLDQRNNESLGVHPNAKTQPFENTENKPIAKIFRFPNSDENFNKAIANFQDNLSQWIYGKIELSRIVKAIRGWIETLWARFIPKNWNDRVVDQPPILLRFQWESHNIHGHYQPGRSDTGFLWEVSINLRHLTSHSELQISATLLHELMHCFMDIAGEAPRSANNYHSAWFRMKAEEFGIPCSRYGADLGIISPSPFMEWALENGIVGDPFQCDPMVSIDRAISQKKSKRVVWRCNCPEGKRVSVLVPYGSDLEARCLKCQGIFKRKK